MNLSNQDFLRRLPDSAFHFARAEGLWRKIHIDPILLLLLLTITAYGLVVLYSASSASERMLTRQGVFFGIAYTAMFVAAQISPNFLRRWALWLYAFGVVLLILIFFIGVGAKGAHRWLSLGFIRFQPSEILKLAVPMLMAAYLSNRDLPPNLKHSFFCMVLIAIPTVLILKQPDLGTSILIMVSGLIVVFLGGLKWRYIISALMLMISGLWPLWHFVMHDYQKRRVLTLFDPESDRLGAGWNIIQSKTAIGSGGIEGKGWLNGTQSHLDFLPESHTDFIIAVLAEEFGLYGVLALLALYFLLIARGLYISWNAQSTFSRLLGGSITLTFFVYVFVNIGMVSGLLPVVGVPLPLVSLGGTSIVTLLSGFGILMAIATERKKVIA